MNYKRKIRKVSEKCPKCGNTLFIKITKEARPYQEGVAYEEISDLWCNTCKKVIE